MTEKKVYTRRIAYELRLKGFKIIRLEPNPNRPEFNIYVFQNTPELESAFKEVVERQEDVMASYILFYLVAKEEYRIRSTSISKNARKPL